MVGSIWHQHSHSSSEPNKYSLASSLLSVVPSSGFLALKKFSYNFKCIYKQIYKFLCLCMAYWVIQVSFHYWITTELHVQCLDDLWIMWMLILSPAHFRPTSQLQVSPQQQRNQVSKVSNVFYFILLLNMMNSLQWTTEAVVSMTDYCLWLTSPHTAPLGSPRPQIASFQPLWPSWTSKHDFMPLNNCILHPSLSPHCEHAGALPLSLLLDSWLLPPLLVPSKKAAITPLYLPSPPPPPVLGSITVE